MNRWLIIYDIGDAKRLSKIAKQMENYGIRVQKSVFEVIAPPARINDLQKEVRQILDLEQDYVVYFDLCDRDWQKREKFGPGKYSEEDIRPFRIL